MIFKKNNVSFYGGKWVCREGKSLIDVLHFFYIPFRYEHCTVKLVDYTIGVMKVAVQSLFEETRYAHLPHSNCHVSFTLLILL